MDNAVLAAEVTNDPEGLGYAGQPDDVVLGLLNAVARSVDRDEIPTAEIVNVVVGDLAGLTSEQRQVLLLILGRESVNIRVPAIRTALGGMFPPGPTRTALAALQTENISRAAELGLGVVRLGDLQRAPGA